MWQEKCKNIPNEYRAIPFWSWNDTLEEGELRRQIGQMQENGAGGFIMHARSGLGTEYLSDEWFDAVAACLDEAQKRGMYAWCYDENGWPSGFAGMKLLQNPANHVHYLTYQAKNEFDPGALAVYVLRGTKLCKVDKDTEADTYHCIYDKTDTTFVDILNPRVVQEFIEITHEEYYKRFAKHFGGTLRGFFTDEPQYYRYDTAYSPELLACWQEEYGADLIEELGALFVECEQANVFRSRYWAMMNRLFTERFIGRLYHWCEEHGCLLTGHAVEEARLNSQMMCCAGAMPFYEYEHIPGVDSLGRFVDTEQPMKQVASVAAQMGKKQVLTESFGCAGWDATPAELKRVGEWQYVNGVTLLCQHLVPYSIRGQRRLDHPPFFSSCNPWVEEGLPEINEHFTTLGFMLSNSSEDAPVGVLHPMHAAYLTYKRLTGSDDAATTCHLDGPFTELVEQLGAWQIGHHYLDEHLLKKHGRVENGKLVLGECAYTAVVIPRMPTLDGSTVALLRQFVEQGGMVCLAGEAPILIDAAPGNYDFLASAQPLHNLPRTFARINRGGTQIRSTCRRSAQGDFVYMVNLSEVDAYSVEWEIDAGGVKEFDLRDKAYTPVYFTREGSVVKVPVTLQPGESLVLLLDDDALPAPAPNTRRAKVQMLDTNMQVVSFGENSFAVDWAEISYDGVEYEEKWPVEALHERLLKERTDRPVWLRYSFTVKEMPNTLFAELDLPKGGRVTLNGKPLPAPQVGTLERLFVRYSLIDALAVGENQFVIQFPYYQAPIVYETLFDRPDISESVVNCLKYDTFIDPLYLRGEFGVESALALLPGEKQTVQTKGPFSLCAPPTQIEARNVTTEGFLFFAGSITLQTKFTLQEKPEKCELVLPGRYAVADVSINEGSTYKCLFDNKCDVTKDIKAGENLLTVTLTGSIRNLYGPFHSAQDAEPYGVGVQTFTLVGSWEGKHSPEYRESYAFVEFGTGDARLEIIQ